MVGIKKNRVCALFLLVIVLLPLAAAEVSILEDDKATLELLITSNFWLEATGSSGYVNEAEAELTWFPRKTYNQLIEEIATSPEAEEHDDYYAFTWDKPPFGKQTITVTSLLSTSNDITPVSVDEPFPLARLEAELIPYTQPSEMIDTNPAIKNLAGDLAAGKENQYEVVFALADWVTTHIDYELSSITAEANYPASWVLEQGYGVCDEMTNLFISLNRALGIPARFVSGLAYTDMEELPTNWGAHGWAEVWFPSVGWVPFDTTYGEYGYVDAGHIKLKDSIDSNENSIEFSGSGRGFDLRSEPLDFDVEVLGTSPRHFDFIEAELSPLADEVAFGGHNLITLRLKNLREYYISTRVELGETTRMSHESADEKNVLLKPYEEKELQFLVKVDENLDPDYVYTFPVTAFTKLSSPVETSFKATPRGTTLTEDILAEEEEKTPLDVEIACGNPSPVRVGSTSITCDFFNKEGKTLSKYQACIDDECEGMTLRDDEEKSFTVEIEKNDPGIYAVMASLAGENKERSHLVTLNVLDETKLDITNIEIPEESAFDEMETLSFSVERISVSAPTRADVVVRHKNFEQVWEDQQILAKQDFNLNFWGQRLKAGENNLDIIVTYMDPFGDEHTISETTSTSLVNLSFGQRLILWFDAADRWLQGLFN